ncbi:MAG: hypothetical protein FJ197_09220 [Gammaproteobacteria bacterium]|nr:hypothetical protein [Gammaproteobacteria bacterium]
MAGTLAAATADVEAHARAYDGPMLRALNGLIVRISSSLPLFLATVAVFVLTLTALTRISNDFPAIAGGALPFDMQNGLTAADVLAQLPGYTEQARAKYRLFTAIDYVFPVAGGLFIAAVAAFCLRRQFAAVYERAVAGAWLPWLMLASLFDWCENVAAIVAINAWPDTTMAMATAIVVAKKLKLGFLFATQGAVALLALASLGRWVAGRLKQA